MKYPFFFLSVLFLLSSCATTPEGNPYKELAPPPGKAVVFVYRPATISGVALTPKVQCAGQEAILRPGNYQPFILDPGHIQCVSNYIENTAVVDLDVAPSHDYYVKETIGMGFFVGHVHLATVDPAYGQNETQNCRSVPAF
jgi:hypothetical protein